VGVHGVGSLFDNVLDAIVVEVEIVHIVTKVFECLVEVEAELTNREDLPIFVGEHTFDEVAVRVAPVVEVGGKAECVCCVCHGVSLRLQFQSGLWVCSVCRIALSPQATGVLVLATPAPQVAIQ